MVFVLLLIHKRIAVIGRRNLTLLTPSPAERERFFRIYKIFSNYHICFISPLIIFLT
jgi:hypothetical protein